MEISLDVINIFLLLVAVLTSSLGVVVYMANRDNKINKYFFVFTIAATLWTMGMFFARNFSGTEYSVSFVRILYVTAITIPFAFIFFINVFPEEKYNLDRKYDIFLIIPFLIVLYITVNPNLLISGVYKPYINEEQIIIFRPIYHYIYAIYIITYFSICYGILFIKYRKFSGVSKDQIVYVIFGTFVSTIIGVSTNLIMPLLGDFSLNWLGQIGIIFMIVSISYSILKHRLFNLKIVATQFIVFLLCISLFIRVLFSTSQGDFIVNSVYLLFSVIIGGLLIKSVISEVEQKEQVEKLANDLKVTNSSLESANDRLKELDQLKSEFLSLATHQIRAPLTAIKGYASLILEGDYGKITSPVESAVKNIFESCQSLVLIVNDFLDISRIEQGRMKYDMSDFDISSLVYDVVQKLKPNIESAGLSVSVVLPEGSINVCLDQNKIRQVVGNIIDNSIKYTKTGTIEVSIIKYDLDAVVSIKDTGIGISKEDISKLFAKFVRAKDASKTNVIGTGLGLYIAKQMVEAQGGKVWVESEGLGKGSNFFIKLPIKK